MMLYSWYKRYFTSSDPNTLWVSEFERKRERKREREHDPIPQAKYK